MLNVEDYKDSGIPKKYLSKIAKCLTGCLCSVPYDKEDDEYYFINDNHCEFETLLEDLDIPQKWHEQIYEELRCPNCGCSLDSMTEVTFDYTIVEQRKYNQIISALTSKSSKIINEFHDYLAKYPYLGANHPTGKDLIKGLKVLETITIENQFYYRARLISESKLFGRADMEPPPISVPIPEGRFNHYGQSHFYLGDKEETCAIECSHRNDCVCWMQKIKINKLEKVLDLTKEYFRYDSYSDKNEIPDLPVAVSGLLLSRKILKEQKTEGSWKTEYLVSRFISDICKELGITGILYPSALYYGNINLVVFDYKNLDCVFDGEPYLYTYKHEELNF